jgi:hypothetical protein
LPAVLVTWLALAGDGAVAELKIDLQDGFRADTVVITVGGYEVARAEDVTSRTQIGFAGSLTVKVPDNEVALNITVPTRRDSDGTSPLTLRLPLDPAAWPHLGVSIDRHGTITTRVSATPFGYL